MIRRDGDPILSTPCKPYVFGPGAEPYRLMGKMRDAMVAERGVGLAAPQIGILTRAFILRDGNSILGCFNPTILSRAGGEERGEEGCLSYPGVFVFVRRAREVQARFQDQSGAWVERRFVGLQARAYQHELDHLDGRTLRDFVPPQALAMARAKAKIRLAA